MIIFFKVLLALILGLTGGIIGSRWINVIYKNQLSVLSFPESQKSRSLFRPYGLSLALMLLYSCLILLTGENNIFSTVSLLLLDYFLILFTFTDFEQQVIFDRMLIPFAIIGLLQTLILQQSLMDHFLAATGGGLIFLLLAVLTHGGIGGGDIKLIAALGLWLGTADLLTVTTVGLFIGGITAFILLVTKQKKRDDFFAYGPYFTLTAIILTILHEY